MLKSLVDFQWIEYCNVCCKRWTEVLWFCIDMTHEGEYMMTDFHFVVINHPFKNFRHILIFLNTHLHLCCSSGTGLDSSRVCCQFYCWHMTRTDRDLATQSGPPSRSMSHCTHTQPNHDRNSVLDSRQLDIWTEVTQTSRQIQIKQQINISPILFIQLHWLNKHTSCYSDYSSQQNEKQRFSHYVRDAVESCCM